MAAEIAEIPDMLTRQVGEVDTYLEVGRQLRDDGVLGLITCARGTSDHAATFFKYLMESQTGLPVASIGPSVASVFGARLQLENHACLTFSQSGSSPDIVALQEAAGQGGARTIAVLNVTDSPVGIGARQVLPLQAGPEVAVAATKSFIGMLFASLAICSGYRDDRNLQREFQSLPELAGKALDVDWSLAALPLARSRSLFCIGRGPGLAIAAEAALKFKETCRIHAEAFSAAEVLHGPIAIADHRMAALVFGAQGVAGDSVRRAADRLLDTGVSVFRTGQGNGHATLPVPASTHDSFDPLLQATAFYMFVERLARDLGENPDAPVGLRKITRTT